MPLNRPRFDVYVNGTDTEPSEHAVVITHQDQLKAEAELARVGINPQARALALTTAWCWASLVRSEEYTGTFKRFHDIDCAGVDTPADGSSTEGDEVDPTHRAAATGLPLLSPEYGPGSTG